ncbi:MAG: hypothetical protein ACRCV9_05550, partial [Burkholderiaceae bacterium]
MSTTATAVVIGPYSTFDGERRFCTSGFITSPTDSLRPNQIFNGRILEVSFSGADTAGIVFFDRQHSSIAGSVILANADGELNGFLELVGINRTVEVRSGDPDMPWSAWGIDYVGLLETAAVSNSIGTLKIGSGASRLDKVINTFHAASSGPREGQALP